MKCTCKPFEYAAGSICPFHVPEEEYVLYGTPEQLERELMSLSARPRSFSVRAMTNRKTTVLRKRESRSEMEVLFL